MTEDDVLTFCGGVRTDRDPVGRRVRRHRHAHPRGDQYGSTTGCDHLRGTDSGDHYGRADVGAGRRTRRRERA
ncbi:MAG: hypothetical protein M3O32_21520 [Actinomycetota bacterium]|nr:hypothetical protein [Actinomycetota bacterium]